MWNTSKYVSSLILIKLIKSNKIEKETKLGLKEIFWLSNRGYFRSV